jgi:hypothetical protein
MCCNNNNNKNNKKQDIKSIKSVVKEVMTSLEFER